MSSMLAVVARAAGLEVETADSPVTAMPTAPQNPLAVATVIAAASRRSIVRTAPAIKASASVYETAEAKAYLANLEALGHRIDTAQRQIILGYGMAWAKSADVRREFSSFGTYAAFMRAQAAGKTKILGR